MINVGRSNYKCHLYCEMKEISQTENEKEIEHHKQDTREVMVKANKHRFK